MSPQFAGGGALKRSAHQVKRSSKTEGPLLSPQHSFPYIVSNRRKGGPQAKRSSSETLLKDRRSAPLTSHLLSFQLPNSVQPSLLLAFHAPYQDLAPRLPPISNPMNARVKKKRTMWASLVNGIKINMISADNKCIIISNS